MAALTKDRNTRTKADVAARHEEIKMATNAKIFLGAGVARNAAGFAVAASDAGALKFLGIAEEFKDNTGGADGAKSVKYVTDIEAEFDNAGGAIVQATEVAYVNDDNSVTTKAVATNGVAVGPVVEFSATKVWCWITSASVVSGNMAETQVNNQKSPAIPVVYTFLVPDAATGDIDIVIGRKIEVIDVTCIKRNGAGAANTMQIKNGATAISDAIACAVDDTVTRAGTIVDGAGTNVIAAGGTLRLTATRAAGTRDALVIVTALLRD